jgi:hypothetical protein
MAHIAMFCLAAAGLVFMLIVTYGILLFCDYLFGEQENYIKIGLIFGEVVLTLYFIKFSPFKTPGTKPS